MEMECRGASVHYEMQGEGAKRVVLLHGWGCEIKLMKPVADFLAKDMRVLSIDFPGFGKSGRPRSPGACRNMPRR